MGFTVIFDVGTTAVKTFVYDEQLKVVGSHISEYTLITGNNSTIEMPPDAYWLGMVGGVQAIAHQRPNVLHSIEAISITTQGETLIPVDTRGNALCNAIDWLDGRATAEADKLDGIFNADTVYPVTGLGGINAQTPVSKLLNLKNTDPALVKNTYKFLLLEDYLIHKLTGEFVTEKSLMSSTGYFNINDDTLYSEILDYIEVEASKIPIILDCGETVGRLTAEASHAFGITTRPLVVTAAMDQVASAIGAGNIASGIVTETTGTALAIAATLDQPDFSHVSKPTIYRHALANKFLVFPFCLTAGIVLKWFKDEFCQLEQTKHKHDMYNVLSRLASTAPIGSNGLLLFPYFSGILTPYNDSSVKGMFYGITLNTKKPSFVRSIFEGVSYMLRENIELIEDMHLDIGKVLSLGGGAKSDVWTQIKADVLGKDISVLANNETTSLGAAMLCSVGAGMVSDVQEFSDINKPVKKFIADTGNHALYESYYLNYKKMHKVHNLMQDTFL